LFARRPLSPESDPVAVTVIPSIYSLKTMRAQKPQSIAPKPMVAYA